MFQISILFNMLVLGLLIVGYVKIKDRSTFRIGAGILLIAAWGLGFYTAEILNISWYFVIMIYFVIGVYSATVWCEQYPNLFKASIISSEIVFFSSLVYVKVFS